MALKPITMTLLCTAGNAAHAGERNPHPAWQKYPYQRQHWITLKKKKKNKCQESFCCCLQQHAPGYDAIMHRDMSIFCQLFQQEATSISLLCLCQHSGREVASGVNDGQEDRWFLLSSGLMAPSFVSVIELRLTDRQIQRQDDDLL